MLFRLNWTHPGFPEYIYFLSRRDSSLSFGVHILLTLVLIARNNQKTILFRLFHFSISWGKAHEAARNGEGESRLITRARVIYSSGFYLGVFILPCILIFDYFFRGTTKNTTSAANQEPVALALERRISDSVEFFLAWTKPPTGQLRMEWIAQVAYLRSKQGNLQFECSIPSQVN